MNLAIRGKALLRGSSGLASGEVERLPMEGI
jgi:hypothetical protein